MQTIELEDAPLARIVKQCRALPGKTLFQYLDTEGARQCVDSAAVNAYLREMTGRSVHGEEFQNMGGDACSRRLPSATCRLCTSDAAFKRNIVGAIDSVADELGNTRAVCRKCYIHPACSKATAAA